MLRPCAQHGRHLPCPHCRLRQRTATTACPRRLPLSPRYRDHGSPRLCGSSAGDLPLPDSSASSQSAVASPTSFASTAQTSHPLSRRALVSPAHPEGRLALLRQAHPLRLTKGAPSSHPHRVPAERVVVFPSHFAAGTQGTAPIGPDGSWSGLRKRGAGQPGRQPVADDRAPVRPGWVLGAGCLSWELLPLPLQPRVRPLLALRSGRQVGLTFSHPEGATCRVVLAP